MSDVTPDSAPSNADAPIADAVVSPIQAQQCGCYGSPLVPVRYDLNVAVALTTLGAQPLYGVRLLPTETTTGWYFWAGEHRSDPDFYEPVHAEHLRELLPEVVPYLALAPGFRFVIDGEGYEDVWFDEQLQLSS